MNNRIAFVLAFLIFAAIAADYLANDAKALLFLARKFVAVVDYIAFWQ
jgi:hypothetical protein